MARNTAISPKSRPVSRTRKMLERIFIQEKLQNVTGYVLMGLIAVSVGFLIATKFVVGMGLFGLTVGFCVAWVCLVNVEAGLYINMVYSFFIYHFSRLFFNDTFPVGLAADGLILATFLGLFFRKDISMRKTMNQFTSNSVIVWILVLLFYLGIELFNPYAHSFDGWFLTFRKMLGAVLLLFVSFNIFKTYDAIRRFFKVLFVLCTITAVYGVFQQFNGLFEFEKNWVMADEIRFGLCFIGGDFRKFSTMSDPTAFGVMMAGGGVMFSVLALGQKKGRNKFIMLVSIILMLMSMAFSGTRTANAMFVAGIFMFILLTINKKSTQLFTCVAGFILLAIIYVPYYDNATINRVRSTFVGSDDKSYNVREINRAFIQPYIYAHPIGGGLGTTGGGGERFNPGHYLAGFPPDSGYLKKALETGWIGLALICVLYFVVLKAGIEGYFACRHEKTKLYYAAATACIFSFYIAEFPQDAIGQITDVVVYYPLVAIILGLREVDKTLPVNDEETT